MLLSFHLRPGGDGPTPRTRQSHRKSRGGCQNCKTRRVKCDETLPTCLHCQRRGADCIYVRIRAGISIRTSTAGLSSASSQIQNLGVNEINAAILNDSLTASAASPDGFRAKSPLFTTSDFQTLSQYRNVTSQTIGDGPVQQIFAAEVVDFAVQDAYLMHAILAVTELHMRVLGSSPGKRTNRELVHWNKTITAYSARLSLPIESSDANSMLATATLINGLAFAMVDSDDPEQSWPCVERSVNANDLWWAKLQAGMFIVFARIGGLPIDGPFRALFENFPKNDPVEQSLSPTEAATIDDLMLDLYSLCDADRHSESPTTNTYLRALTLLDVSLRLPTETLTMENCHPILSFVGMMSPTYMQSLQDKDHRALLIFCIWYGKAQLIPCWWTAGRAKLEHQAIAIYLKRKANATILQLLHKTQDGCCLSQVRPRITELPEIYAANPHT